MQRALLAVVDGRTEAPDPFWRVSREQTLANRTDLTATPKARRGDGTPAPLTLDVEGGTDDIYIVMTRYASGAIRFPHAQRNRLVAESAEGHARTPIGFDPRSSCTSAERADAVDSSAPPSRLWCSRWPGRLPTMPSPNSPCCWEPPRGSWKDRPEGWTSRSPRRTRQQRRSSCR